MKKDELVKKSLVLTGGHAATAAISVVEELLRRGNSSPFGKIVWFGASSAVEGKKVLPLELQVFGKMGIEVHPIISGKLQVRFTRWTIPSLVKIPFSFFQAFFKLLKVKPGLVLSFGAFTAFPVVVVAKLLGIPVIIHEQTRVAGRTNRITARLAKKVTLARKESEKFFPKGKTTVVGNPIMTQITEVAPKDKMGKPPTLVIFGGSRGAHRINLLIHELLNSLVVKFLVIHQTGVDDYEMMLRKKNEFGGDLKDRYEVYAVIDPMQIDNVYRQADIIVARAGANTVSEILVTRRPAILIPLPFAYLNEQEVNARAAEEVGIAKVLKGEDLTADTLMATINEIEGSWEKMVKKARDYKSSDIGASEKLVNIMEEMIR